ncbi:MAG TPA: hypothetical protein EYN26_08790 [Chromatiales bacterium]|nr:hypothetical protein [Chromatiales bacterium]
MSEQGLFLVLDQGTHASRAGLYLANGNCVYRAQHEIALCRLSDERVEQDANEIVTSLKTLITQSVGFAEEQGATIARAGLATQRSSVLAWRRRDGVALSPVLSWQDTRGHKMLARMRDRHATIRATTGLRPSPHYGASKLHWLLHNNQQVMDTAATDGLCLGPLASYVVFHLLEGSPFVVDHSNASRTLLMDQHSLRWDPELLRTFEIDARCLPDLAPTQASYGQIQGTDIELSLLCGDQSAAFYGFGDSSQTTATVNVGTGAFILMRTDHAVVVDQLLSTVVFSADSGPEYAIEGTVNGAGSALAWLQCEFGIEIMDEQSWPDVVNPPVFINTVGGVGSPWWCEGKAPLLLDGEWHRYSSLQQVAAVMESMVFMIAANLDAMRETGRRVESVQIGGGVANDNGFCQRLSDVSGLPVRRFGDEELTANGLAWCLAGRPQDWIRSSCDVFDPTPNATVTQRYRRFCQSMACVAGDKLPVPLIAHRGEMVNFPENTLPALAHAIEVGAEYLELDVQISSDGVAVCVHDWELRRTTGADGVVGEHTAEQLQRLLATEHLSGKPVAAFIPTLAAVVELVNSKPELSLFVEAKRQSIEQNGVAAVVDTIMEVMRKANFPWILISFESAALDYAREQYAVPVGLAVRKYDEAHRIVANQLAPDYVFCNRNKIEVGESTLWPGGWHWVIYDVVDVGEIARWVNAGADFIETGAIGEVLAAGVNPDAA